MIGTALALTRCAIVWPGMQVSIVLLAGALIGFAVFGLLTADE